MSSLHAISQAQGQVWQDYAPNWTSSGTQPAIGNGTIVGRYLLLGKCVIARASITMGSTTTYGTGTYSVSLPIAESSGAGNALGLGIAFDNSAVQIFIAHWRAESLYTLASPVGFYGPTTPFTWATSDQLQVEIIYQIA